MNTYEKLFKLFTPAAGSRVRNIVRAVLPVLQLFGVVNLTGEQIAALMVAIEVLFAGGAEITKRV